MPGATSRITVEGTVGAREIEGGYRAVPRDEPAPLRITLRWYQPASWAIVMAAIVWNLISAIWWWATFATGNHSALFHPAFFVVVGLLVMYGALCELVNRTVFTIASGWLRVRHGPFPCGGAVDVAVGAIASVRVRERSDTDGGLAYDVCAVVERHDVALLTGLPRREAEHLTQLLSRHLGLRDAA